ncbi:MAG: glutathione S-transferase family protein [Pseudomonadota bacterium]
MNPTPEIILHHFDASPFAEKARLALGLKQASWYAVEIPMIMPKPDLTALTGGYRKTPVLQAGAEVYCDTALILRELDARLPGPDLFAGELGGLGSALGSWSDQTFFQPGAGLSMGLNDQIPRPLLDDRKAFFNFMDFDQLKDEIPHLYAQFLAQVDLVTTQLADGRHFLAGDLPSVADILAYFPLWMARGNFPAVDEWLDHEAALAAWEQRMAAFGHGNSQPLGAEAALDLAREGSPAEDLAVERNPEALAAGQPVTVTPQDYGRIPVHGDLLGLTRNRVTVRRSDPRVGEVNVHFPRSGYRVTAR